MRTRTRLAACAAAGALIGAVAVTATGTAAQQHSRAPKPAERTAITAAAKSTVPSADRGRFRITGIRVSTRSRYWAKAVVAPKPAYRNSLQGAYMVLVRSAITGRWIPLDPGTSGVGCTIAPAAVLRDLGIAGECPIGESL